MTARWFLPVPPPDTTRVLAALSEPLGLPGASLPAYGVPGPGCCRECLRPPVHSQGLCVYCAELTRARGETDACEHGLAKALCLGQPRRDRTLGRAGDGSCACLWLSRGPCAYCLGRKRRNLGRAVVMTLLLCLAVAVLCWATGMIR